MNAWLAIDSGGTKTHLLLADTQGNTFMTDLIFLDFNGFMPFTGVDSSFPDSLAKLGAAVTVSDDRVQVMLLTENRGEEPEEYALIRLSVKPTPSIARPQQTVDTEGHPRELVITGRHDPVIVPRAVVVAETMAALVLLDSMMMNMSSKTEAIRRFYGRV